MFQFRIHISENIPTVSTHFAIIANIQSQKHVYIKKKCFAGNEYLDYFIYKLSVFMLLSAGILMFFYSKIILEKERK